MKKDYFDYMLTVMRENPDVYMLFGGLGWPRIDDFLSEFPGRAINCEASEQTMMDMAVGLAYSGKLPFCYTISPFYLRAFETLRTYLNHENLHIVMVGAGRNDDYSKDDGFSHDAADIPTILDTLYNIEQYYPLNKAELIKAINRSLFLVEPSFISLTR